MSNTTTSLAVYEINDIPMQRQMSYANAGSGGCGGNSQVSGAKLQGQHHSPNLKGGRPGQVRLAWKRNMAICLFYFGNLGYLLCK